MEMLFFRKLFFSDFLFLDRKLHFTALMSAQNKPYNTRKDYNAYIAERHVREHTLRCTSTSLRALQINKKPTADSRGKEWLV